MVLLPVVTFAAIGDVPEGDPFANLLNVILNWQTMGVLVLASSIVTIVMQAMKKFIGDFKFKRLINVLLSTVLAVLATAATGASWPSAVALALFTSGGAAAIYNELLPLLKGE